MNRRSLAVLMGSPASLTPAQIVTAAADSLPVLFVLAQGTSGPEADRLTTVTEALAPTVHADFTDAAGCAQEIREAGAAAVTTFTDWLCPLATAICAHLDPDPGQQPWEGKDVIRRRLVQAGVSRVRSAVLRTPQEAQKLMLEWDSGLVVKPVDGASSTDIWLLNTSQDVEEFMAASHGHGGTWRRLAEEFISGVPRESAHLGDYVSVEVIRPARGAKPRLAFVTDRAPLAAPCRETALMWPTTLPETTVAGLVATANDALNVLAAGRGSYHVEMKPGPGNNEIVEVNGRLGGFLARAAGYGADVDLVRLALGNAAGEPDQQPPTMTWHRCVAFMMFPAPQAARRITRAPDRRTLGRLPGVQAIDALRGEGEECTWQRGSGDAVANVWLTAADHQDLRIRFLTTAEYLSHSFNFVDGDGRAVIGNAWLDELRARSGPDLEGRPSRRG